MINVKKCFEKGLLKKMNPSMGLAKKSLKQARYFLGEARDMNKIGKDIMFIIAIYNSFFHCARALLFRDGVKEKSHYCVARYTEEKYVNSDKIDVKFLNHLERLRDIRHDVQYSVNNAAIEEDNEEIIKICSKFINITEKELSR